MTNGQRFKNYGYISILSGRLDVPRVPPTMFRHLTKQLKRHRSGLTQAVALFFAATILIASIGRTKATTLRLTPPPTATAGDGGLFSFSGDDWLVNLMLAAVAFAGTTSPYLAHGGEGRHVRWFDCHRLHAFLGRRGRHAQPAAGAAGGHIRRRRRFLGTWFYVFGPPL